MYKRQCLLGACNITVLWEVIRSRQIKILSLFVRDVEHRALGVLVIVVTGLGLVFTGVQQFGTVLVEAIFFVSSAGFDYHVIGLEISPQGLLIALALIGGSALSTAGGVKLIRILLLFRHVETDLGRLTHPSRLIPVKFRGQVLPDEAFLSVWMYFFGYTMVFAAGILAFSIVGLNFDMAVAACAASLANIGPLLDMTLPPYSFDAFTDLQLFVSSVLMIMGRVEVLAAFAALSPGLWRA